MRNELGGDDDSKAHCRDATLSQLNGLIENAFYGCVCVWIVCASALMWIPYNLNEKKLSDWMIQSRFFSISEQ